AVLDAVRKKALSGCYTPVVELLSVPEAYRVAIEVALGAATQDIVCDTEEEAKAAIAWLKKHRAGRATFLALPLLRPPTPLPSEILKTLDGIIGLAAEQVRVEAKYAPVVQLLLGRVVIAEEMDSAIRGARQLQGWSRIVTCEGEVLTPGGALTGGSLQGRGSHLIGRKGEIDDLRQALPSLQAEVEERARQLESASLHLRKLDSAAAEVDRNLAEIHTQMVTCERDLHVEQQEEVRLETRRREIWDEITRRRALHDSLLAEVAEREAAWVASRAEDTRLDETAAVAKAEIDTLVARHEQARETVVALEIETGKLAEKVAELRRSIAANREALHQLHLTRADKEAQRDQVAGEWKEADSLRRELECEQEEARAHRERCGRKLSELQTRRQRWRDEHRQKTAAMKERTGQRAQLIQQMHDAELTIARLEVRLNQLAQRLQDDYNIALEQALASEITIDMDRETVHEVARLRREIHAMGAVNTGAVEEYKRLTDRHNFLATQCADLERARESLLATLAEIEKSTRGTFMETFHAVAKEFDRLFTRLFGGGTTRLILTNPNDLLETGVEVIVQPPGKKAQNLLLLSGGERALTAIALLFSFLAVRPSPFVVLDEVDAPLDGANVERFVALVREFTQQTQFLIITHNPTTIEAAPRWYGVTMPEPGVSRILSYRVPEEAREIDRDVAVVAQRK
ncbi:MAG TPA: chromosome segregation protein SMC, partial [Chthonomonadales bacterium]|nr:chromosome segregation protein SMC [Chthonomonadales bacterium]